jgi:hypothetical protein
MRDVTTKHFATTADYLVDVARLRAERDEHPSVGPAVPDLQGRDVHPTLPQVIDGAQLTIDRLSSVRAGLVLDLQSVDLQLAEARRVRAAAEAEVVRGPGEFHDPSPDAEVSWVTPR